MIQNSLDNDDMNIYVILHIIRVIVIIIFVVVTVKVYLIYKTNITKNISSFFVKNFGGGGQNSPVLKKNDWKILLLLLLHSVLNAYKVEISCGG